MLNCLFYNLYAFILLALPLSITANRWTAVQQEAFIKASNPGSFDSFGNSVALDSNIIVVGARQEASCSQSINGPQGDNCAFQGAAYAYVRASPSTWWPDAYLKASNGEMSDEFGYAVAIDGDLVVVGAPEERSCATGLYVNTSDSGCDASGAAYIFGHSTQSGIWWEELIVKGSNTEAGDRFGSAVAISGDTVVVGVQEEGSCLSNMPSDNNCMRAGAAYVIRRNRATGYWWQEAYLKASNPDSGNRFGRAIDIDGDFIVVGSPREAGCSVGVNGPQTVGCGGAGAAYVFRRNAMGVWLQTHYLKSNITSPGARFGSAVAIDAHLIVVGAPWETGNCGEAVCSRAGAAYVFERVVVTGEWMQIAFLQASNVGAYMEFGQEVDVDGDTIVVGTAIEAGNAGAVYVFHRGVDNAFAQVSLLSGHNTHTGDQFHTVSISGDTLVIGAIGEDSCSPGVNNFMEQPGCLESGAAYVFRDVTPPSSLAPTATPTSSPAAAQIEGSVPTLAPTLHPAAGFQTVTKPALTTTSSSVSDWPSSTTYSTSTSATSLPALASPFVFATSSSMVSTTLTMTTFLSTSLLEMITPGNTGGAMIGLIVGGLCLLTLLLVALFVILRFRRKKQPRKRRGLEQGTSYASEHGDVRGGGGGSRTGGNTIMLTPFPKADTAALSSPRRSRAAADSSRRSTHGRSRRSSRRISARQALPIGSNYVNFSIASNVYDLAPDLTTPTLATLGAATHYVEFPVEEATQKQGHLASDSAQSISNTSRIGMTDYERFPVEES